MRSAVQSLHKTLYMLKLHTNSAKKWSTSHCLTVIIRLLQKNWLLRPWQKPSNMDSNLYCSQYKDVDRSTMGTATTTDDIGNTVRRSTRERTQWVNAPSSTQLHHFVRESNSSLLSPWYFTFSSITYRPPELAANNTGKNDAKGGTKEHNE